MAGGSGQLERQLVQNLRSDLNLICNESRKRYPAVREVSHIALLASGEPGSGDGVLTAAVGCRARDCQPPLHANTVDSGGREGENSGRNSQLPRSTGTFNNTTCS